MPNQGRVLIIAGSDPGGGAGIQGDIKTVTVLGGYASAAITALTAQNTQGVFGIHAVPVDFVRQQVTLVLDDIGADAIKTGMLHTAEIIEMIASLLCSPLGGERARASVSAARAVGGNPTIRKKAKELRKNASEAEQKLWYFLSQKKLGGFKFRRQQPIGGQYIADFTCLEKKIIIELDGSQHADQQEYDQERDTFLKSEGYRVIRVWNNELFENTEGLLETILNALQTPHDSLRSSAPPQGGSNSRIPFVLDPVMFAKGGAALLEENALHALKHTLLPLATVVTPNIPEAEYLSGLKIRSIEDMKKAAQKILSSGCKAVCLKGGHMEGDILTDILADKNGSEIFSDARLNTKHTHGTGCTLASAIATGLAQGLSLRESVTHARAFVRKAMENAPGLGHGHGPLGHAKSALL